mgnify:CR=1 FL=1
MTTIIATLTDGSERQIAVKPDQTLMQAIRDAGVDELLALCGGGCSCGTCHVYVDPGAFVQLPPANEEEAELMSIFENLTAHSRLSCQLPCPVLPEGMRITMPPSD